MPQKTHLPMFNPLNYLRLGSQNPDEPEVFPVVDNGRLLGCVTTRDIQEIPRDEWERHMVREITRECSAENSISADTDAMKALLQMNRMKASRTLVVRNGSLDGIVSLKDLMRFLSLKIDLEEDEAPPFSSNNEFEPVVSD